MRLQTPFAAQSIEVIFERFFDSEPDQVCHARIVMVR